MANLTQSSESAALPDRQPRTERGFWIIGLRGGVSARRQPKRVEERWGGGGGKDGHHGDLELVGDSEDDERAVDGHARGQARLGLAGRRDASNASGEAPFEKVD